jgi:hypothetical protein
MSEARFTFSASEGRIEVSGTEDFVSKQVQEFGDVIRDMLKNAPPANAKQDLGGGGGGGGGTLPKFDEFVNVLASEGGKVQILKPLPGTNNAAQTVSAALLTLFGNSLLGIDEIASSVIREACQSHGCLDSSNFAGTIKDQKEHFIVTGSRSNTNIKLTKPGMRAAEQLARSLNK